MVIIKNTLSICIISKNEEKNIGRCIKSVLSIADEIVVVDTGSTDNTVKIAKSLGVKVLEHSWNNDFSEARNLSIDTATKDWILFLDCDEEMTLTEGEKLKEIINSNENNEKFEALYLRLVNIIAGSRISDAIVLRAFKNKPEYRFQGKIHEQIVNSIEREKGYGTIAATAIEILHYGYDPEVSDPDKKSKRNLDILLTYEERDKDGYYYYVLGNEYARVYDFNEALRIYDLALEKNNLNETNFIYYPYLAMNIIRIYYTQKRYNDCVKVIDNFKETLAGFKDMYFMECLSYVEMSKLTKASEALDRYLNTNKGSYEYPSNNFENFHDIPKLIEDLSKGIVPHGENMLSVWIRMDHWDEKIIEGIKSVNEIACEVLVFTRFLDKNHADTIQQYGGTVVDLSRNYEYEFYKIAANSTKGRYVLFMQPNELCGYLAQIQLSNLLNSYDDIEDAFLLRIVELETGNFQLRVSLFKNNREVQSLEEYNQILARRGQPPYDIEIPLHYKSIN